MLKSIMLLFLNAFIAAVFGLITQFSVLQRTLIRKIFDVQFKIIPDSRTKIEFFAFIVNSDWAMFAVFNRYACNYFCSFHQLIISLLFTEVNIFVVRFLAICLNLKIVFLQLIRSWFWKWSTLRCCPFLA